jgi:uncharacterized damage-inducible protein DinB
VAHVTTTRPEPPLTADEPTMLRGWLDWHRATLRQKTDGLDHAGLNQRLEPSTLTLAALVKHMAHVEDDWFGVMLMGREYVEPWASADWDADRDWEMTSAAADSPQELRRLLDEAIDASDAILDQVLADDGLDRLSVREDRRGGGPFNLRWILVHMIEEYARHNGHADLIRESIDGARGV